MRQQHPRKRQARFLPSAQFCRRKISRDGIQPQCGKGLLHLPGIFRGGRDPLQQTVVFAIHRFIPGRCPHLLRQGFELEGQFVQIPGRAVDKPLHGFAVCKAEALCQVAGAQVGGGEFHRTGICLFLPHEDAHQGGLAAPVGSHQAGFLPRVQGEADLAEDIRDIIRF